jgi:circadian clock protein KaiC
MAKQTGTTIPKAIAKVSSGICGLDEILHGGFPAGRVTLLCGGPGSGKTFFGLEFLVRSALAGRPGILVSFEERADAIRDNALSLGWDLSAMEKSGRLFILEARLDRHAIVAGDFDIDPLLAILQGQARRMNAACVVIDAVDAFMRVFRDPGREREEMGKLHDWLLDSRFTALMTSKLSNASGSPNGYEFLEYMTDCVLVLDQRVAGQVTTRRLRVLKYRGSGFGSNEYPFILTEKGCLVMPVSMVSLDGKPQGDRLTTGIDALDALLPGGYRWGSVVLITGPTGTGKTTLVCSFVRQACARREKVLYIGFEESQEMMLANMLSPGIDLRPALDAGTLEILATMPESMGVEHHLFGALERIDRLGVDHVVVDAISACHRMGSEQAAFDYLVRLIDLCSRKGLTLFLINQLDADQTQHDLSTIGISSLIDTIVLLQYRRWDGRFGRTLRIYKSRGSSHSAGEHPFVITDDGVRIDPKGLQNEPDTETAGSTVD